MGGREGFLGKLGGGSFGGVSHGVLATVSHLGTCGGSRRRGADLLGDEWEVSRREASSLGPGLAGIREVGCWPWGGVGEGQKEQERGPRAFQALQLEGLL